MQFFYILFCLFPNHDCKDIRIFNTKQIFENELPPTHFSISPNHLTIYFTNTYTATSYSSSNLGEVISVSYYTQNSAFNHQAPTPHLSVMDSLLYFFTFFIYSVGVIPSTLLNVLKKLDFLKPHFSLRAVKVYFLYSPSSISRLNSSKRYLLINS